MKQENVAIDFLDAVAEQVASKLLPKVLITLANQLPVVNDKTMEIPEAADYIGISKELLYKLCSGKNIPHIRAGSEGTRKPKLLFSSYSLDRWKREQEQANCPGWK